MKLTNASTNAIIPKTEITSNEINIDPLHAVKPIAIVSIILKWPKVPTKLTKYTIVPSKNLPEVKYWSSMSPVA